MTQPIATWLKDLLPRTPGINRKVATREFIMAAREFFRQSTVWRVALENSYFADGEYGYTAVTSEPDSEIVQIYSVEANGIQLQPVVERPTGERTTGTPTRWIPLGLNRFDVWPTPDVYDDTVIIRAILIPTASTTTLPDFAYARWYDAFIDGALGRIYAHPAKPYSNPTLGEYHLRRFRSAIGQASGESKQGGIVAQNWVFPPFAK